MRALLKTAETVSQPYPIITGKTGETYFRSNQEFLRNVFNEELAGARPMVVSFKGDPGTVSEKAWFGRPWQSSSDLTTDLPADANNYFTPAVFKSDEAGKYRRQKRHFQALYAVMLDDVGTKVPISRLTLPPSWLLETSPGNCQVGYLLREPITDSPAANRLMNAIVAASLCDPGANGPSTRLARLPIAVNGKHSPPFRCRMLTWSPEVRYTIEELTAGLQLEMVSRGRARRQGTRSMQERPAAGDPVWIPPPDENAVLVALRDRGLYKAPLGEGKY